MLNDQLHSASQEDRPQRYHLPVFSRIHELTLIGGRRCERVIETFAKQRDIDANRQSFAWRNGRSALDKTSCQTLLEHSLFDPLFGGITGAYQ